ncbi:hypothetical protein WKI68_01580 [Streptomyces sp. MS1.HAVA.3]|uniref:Uncharacterized protein n=1 Tax=Streptomyces caledonius TaxID=3134107 RepID=A0ABU8TXY0_9ACTN
MSIVLVPALAALLGRSTWWPVRPRRSGAAVGGPEHARTGSWSAEAAPDTPRRRPRRTVRGPAHAGAFGVRRACRPRGCPSARRGPPAAPCPSRSPGSSPPGWSAAPR